jgi:hypothetical protein
MIDRRRQVVVDGVGESVAVANRHRREIHAIGHVPDRVDGLHAALREFVDDHGAGVIQLHARPIESEAFGIRITPNGEQHDVDFGFLSGRQRGTDGAALFLQLRQRGLHRQLCAAALQFDVHVRAQIIIETAQHLVAAMENAHLRTEPVKDIRELERHITAADDERAFGKPVEQKGFVRGNAKFETRQPFG